MSLELVQTTSELLVYPLKLFDFAVAFVDSVEQLRVSSLALQETLDKGVDVGDAGGGLDLLEGFVNGLRAAHFLFHLFTHESVPKLVDHEFVAPLKLRRVLVLTRSGLGNLLVPALTLNAAIHGCLFVSDALAEFEETFRTVTLLFFNIFEQICEDCTRLKAFLFCLTLLILLQIE